MKSAVEWWREEWEIKNREAEGLLAVLCGVCFFLGTVVG